MTDNDLKIDEKQLEDKAKQLLDTVNNLVVKVDDLEQAVEVEVGEVIPLPLQATLPLVITKINEIIAKLRLN